MERIELPRQLAIALLHDAQASPDKEVCGLLAALDGVPCRLIPVRNAAAAPARLFDMDERELIDAMKGMRARGEHLFAVYHSHPASAPEPSQRDIERAGYPEVLHFIVSLEVKGVLQMRGWRLNGERPRAVEIGVAEDT